MSPDSLMVRLCRARAHGIVDADAELLAEMLWLVALLEDEAGGQAPKLATHESINESSPSSRQAPPEPRPVGTPSDYSNHAGEPSRNVPLYPEFVPERPSRTISASFLKLPTGDPLPQRHQLERAFKPFKRRFPSRDKRVLDLDATAEQSAERRAVTPVYRAARERWFDVALITDATDGMHVWRESLGELQRLLARHGAFRQVRLWRYTIHKGNLSLVSSNGCVVSPGTTVDPLGRRIFIFLTNGTSRDWIDPALVDFVDMLGQKCPTAIIQMMPRRAWAHTALGDALAQATSFAPGEATKRLRVRNRFTGVNETAVNALAVPVMPLEAEAIGKWAQFLMGQRRSTHFAVKLHRKVALTSTDGAMPPSLESRALVHDGAPTPAKRVAMFRSIASPQAYQLMRLMAGVPLSLPIIRLLHASMSGDLKQSHLAEVLLSGLIERRTPNEAQVDPETVQYEFKEGVRDTLLNSLSVDETRTIDGVVKSTRAQAREFVTLHAGRTQHEFRALVPNAAGQQALLETAESFLDVSEKILRKMFPHRDISQVEHTSSALSGERAEVAMLSPFYSERRIVAELRKSGALHQTEQVTGTLLIYSTDSQHTWLIATARALLFVLDDASTRESGNLVQRAESWFDVMPVVIGGLSGAALVGFGSPKNSQWYYSTELYPEPSSLEFEVAKLAPGGVQGPLQQIGRMARDYERMRETMPPGHQRTAAMSRLVDDMRSMVASKNFDLDMVVKSKFEGSQLAAVVSLQRNFQIRHTDWLVRLLENDHAFLAFQAARALLNSVSLHDENARKTLRDDVRNVMTSLKLRGLVDGGVHAQLADIVGAIDLLDKARRGQKIRKMSFHDEPATWADVQLSKDLRGLILSGESETLEFKQHLSNHVRDLAKEIAAFASTSGGRLLLGVADDGSIPGVTNADDPAVRDELAMILMGVFRIIDPPVHPRIEWASVNGAGVLVITVEKGPKPPYYVDSRAYVRHGAASRLATSAEVSAVLAASVWEASKGSKNRPEFFSLVEVLAAVRRWAGMELDMRSLKPWVEEWFAEAEVYASKLHDMSVIDWPIQSTINERLEAMAVKLDEVSNFRHHLDKGKEFIAVRKSIAVYINELMSDLVGLGVEIQDEFQDAIAKLARTLSKVAVVKSF